MLLLGLSAGLAIAAAEQARAGNPSLPLGLSFVPPGLDRPRTGGGAAEAGSVGGLSVLHSLASTEVAPAAPPEAAEPARGETVLARARPDYDPIGLPIGAFEAFPGLTVEERLDDNIFRTDGGETADLITTIRPRLGVRSTWPNHALALDLDGAIGIFADNGSEDFEDVRAGAAGRLDIDSSAYAGAGASFRKLHEDRGSPDDVNGRAPTEYNVTTANAELGKSFGRFATRIDGQVESLNYMDADALVAGTLLELNNDDRDRNIYAGNGRVSYRFLPETSAYLRASGNLRDYHSGVDDSGVNRDSGGYGMAGGVEVDLGGLMFADAFLGYRWQRYDDGALEDFSGIDFGADLTWNVTPLTTVVASAASSVEETTLPGASSFARNRGALSVDHELLRNLLVLLDGAFERNDYEGIDRRDDIISASAEARYLVSRNVYLSGAYRFRTRDSDGGTDFTENAGLMKLGLQY